MFTNLLNSIKASRPVQFINRNKVIVMISLAILASLLVPAVRGWIMALFAKAPVDEAVDAASETATEAFSNLFS